MKKCALIGSLAGLAITSLSAAPPLPEKVEFNRDIRPILAENCYACHGPDSAERKAELRLDLDAKIYDEQEGGAFIIKPGKVMDSELWHRITTDDEDARMPPQKTNKSLSEREIAMVKKWIEQGATYQGHWAFIPPKKSPPPKVAGDHPVNNEIDLFIQAALKEQGLKPSPKADPVTLVRRIYFDLIGLPPNPHMVEKFSKNPTKEAYREMVTDLLNSEHFGERMAIYWLDMVRFADSNGYHSDEARSVAPYRDYVIEAFNKNKPFDQFVIEQLAGDLLPEASVEQKIASGFNMLLQTTNEGGAQPKEYLAKYAADRVRNTGTIFMGLTTGCAECHDHKFDPISADDFYNMQAIFADIREAGKGNPPAYPVPSSKHEKQIGEIDGKIAVAKQKLEEDRKKVAAAQATWEVETVSQIADTPIPGSWHQLGPFRGASFDEAHAKDFGPETGVDLSQEQGGQKWVEKKDFTDGKVHTLSGDNSATYLYRTILSSADQPLELALGSDDSYRLWVNGTLAKDQKVLRGVTLDQDKVTINLKKGENQILFKVANGGGGYGFAFRMTKAGLPGNIMSVLNIAKNERNPAQQEELNKYYASVSPVLEPARKAIADLEKQKKDLQGSFPKTLMTVSTTPRVIRKLPRGNWMDDSGPEMSPAIPAVFGSLEIKDRRMNRLDFAEWLVRKDHPLTARTFVNRTWKLFFGHGISGRLDDLGIQGEWPTHPELLDNLSVQFVESGWDVKELVRTMVLSATYQQQSTDTPELREADPKNRYYARQSRWRLDAELVRDNALSVSGLLVPEIGGASVKPYQPAGYWRHMNFPKRKWTADMGENQYRRGLYTWWQRMFLHPSMVAFDAPSREESCVERPRSNTPQQALALLNDPTYVESARVFAQRMIKEGGATTEERIGWAYRQAMSRPVQPEEAKLLTDIFLSHREEYAADKPSAEAFIAIGQSKADPALDPVALAAWSSVSRILLNLHETITRR